MAQEYLPAPSNVRLADLMKEHNISQPELAKEMLLQEHHQPFYQWRTRNPDP